MPRPARVAFGAFPDWEASIRAGLDARYAPSFVDLAEADLDAFDAVVPLAISHYEALASRSDLRGRKFHHPAAETVALCHDKLALNRFLIAQGFGAATPPLRAPGAPYPYVWKRRRGGWGRQAHVVDGPEAEKAFDLADPDWFAQSPVLGATEYATHILRVGGRLRYVSTFVHGMAGPLLIFGERHRGRSLHFMRGCPHLALFAEILARLDYEGSACFDYKVEAGQARLFEINPRYGASLGYDITTYVDAYVAALQPG